MRISALALSYVIGTLTSSTTGSFVWQCQGFTHTVLTHSSSRSSSSSSSSSSSIVVPSSSSLHYHNHRHNHRRNRVGGSNDRKLSSSSVLFVRPPSMTNDKAWKWSRRMRRFVTSATVAALPFVVGPSDVQAKVPFGWTGESITEMIIKDAQNEELDIRQAAELEHTAKLNAIRREKGEFAAKQFDETFKAKLRLEDAQKSLQTAMLKRDLLLKGIQPNSLEFNGYLFEKLYGVNLFEVPGTEYQTVFGELQKMSPEELQQKRKENLVTYKEEIDEALKIVELSKANVKRMAASLGVEVDLGEDDQAIASTEVVPSDKEKLKLEKAKAKEEAKLLKEKKKAENKAAKEEANRLKAELKAKAKKEKDDLQLAAKAAAAAAAGTVAAGQAAANEVASQVVEQTNMASMITEDGVEQHITSDDQADVTDQSSMALVNDKESNIGTSSTKDGKFKIIKTAGASIGVGVVAFQGWAVYKKRSDDAEAKRMEQFKLIMGNSDSEDAPDEPTSFDDSVSSKYNQFSSGSEPSEPIVETTLESANEVSGPQDTNVEPAVVPEIGKKKKKKGIAGIFSKNDENARETDINNLFVSSAVASNFSKVLAGILTFGAPGRFPEIESLEGRPSTFELESAKEILSQTREDEGLTTVQAAESFACVVNCMIITIIDLASSTLKEKDDKVTVDALNVVLDFMDHAASLYDAVADGVVINPVTYGGTLGAKKLEQMFSKFAGGSLTILDTSAQDRMDTLQQVFKISDKKAEGLTQKVMMKNLMKLMKDGGEGLEGMEGMEEMMKAMGGAEGLGGLGGLGGMGMGDMGDINPEELKQTISMMTELMESGQVSKEEMKQIREEFKKANGIDLTELIKAAEGMGEEDLGEEGKELLDLFKKVLGED